MKKISMSVLVMAIFYGLFIERLFAQNKEFEAMKQQIEDTSTSVKPQQPETIVLPKVEYKEENMRDPFVWQIKPDLGLASVKEEKKDTGETPLAPPALKVTGILWGGGLPQAIINNKVVKVGDTLLEAKIISIDKEGVKVSFHNKVFDLPSPGSSQLESLKKTQKEEKK